MYKAHWDSQKEYEEFWDGRKAYPMAKKKNSAKKKTLGFWIVVILACIGLLAITMFEQIFSPINYLTSKSIVSSNPDSIPEFAGEDYIVLNQNVPNFTEGDHLIVPCEIYSDLDLLGRCGPAFAVLHESMMPTDERESIGQIKPSGWSQKKYDGIVKSNPPYLYNRCHLIAFALAGENANEKNLITGTRHFNEIGMLPFERIVLEYLETSENHVLYRVSPYFKNDELVARGVEIEAYSVEDNGAGICFHVFIYNHQPGIYIDYATGANSEY